MKKFLLLMTIAICIFSGCKEKVDWSKVREQPSAQSLLSEIKDRDDVAEAIISDVGGLCVAMDIDANKAQYIVPYFLKMAKNNHVNIEFCKIVSSTDYKSDGTYMNGTKLAFDNQK